MSPKIMSQSEREELWQWLQQTPAPMEPVPGWMIRSIDDPALFRRFAEADLDLRTRALELELAKLQSMKELIGTLPQPLP